jgi:hypothetical protein
LLSAYGPSRDRRNSRWPGPHRREAESDLLDRTPAAEDHRPTSKADTGYRAVHVIVYPGSFPIGIQVRTRWQHQWAEWYERLADQYGRGIRYGEPPVDGGDSAQQTINWMLEVADQLAEAEESGGTPPLSVITLQLLGSVIEWLQARQRDRDP